MKNTRIYYVELSNLENTTAELRETTKRVFGYILLDRGKNEGGKTRKYSKDKVN